MKAEFLSQSQIINQHNYRDVLPSLSLVWSPSKFGLIWSEKRQKLNENKSWLLHHNAPAQIVFSIWEFFAKNNIAVLEQPSYSPDLALSNFFLFSNLKKVIQGTHFPDVDAIKMAVTKKLRAIPKNLSWSAWRHGTVR